VKALLPLYTLLLAACSPLDDTMLDASSEIKIVTTIVCTDPRPEICTMEYRPVCASGLSGELTTFSSACSACSDQKVLHYKIGECEIAE
jgi:hypothetical protein